MSIVPLLTQDQFASVDQPVLTQGVEGFGQLLNTWAAIGHSPGLFATYLPFLRQLNAPGALDQRLKELTAVRVAVLNHCRYTASHRCTSALAKGVSENDLGAVARGEFTSFTEQERVALELSDDITAANSPASMEEAQRVFAPQELVELVMSISVWNALSRFHRAMAFELDMPPAPAGVEAEL